MITRTILQKGSFPLLLSLLLFVVFNDKVCIGASLQYGDKCMITGDNSTVEHMCNEKESLTCQNGTCLCSDMSSMTYDPSLGLCVGKADHACSYHGTEKHLPLFRKNHCVKYASCENRICKCWSAFYRDESSHCSRKRGYLQQCQMDDECDGRKGLICKDSLCQCETKKAAYNPELERCVGLPGEACANQYRECVDNYKCKVGVCVCKFKEIGGKNGEMKCDPVSHRYGKNCGRSRGDCGAELSCINGKCRCHNPDYQVYDYEQRICVSLVGGPCTVLTPPSTTLVIDEVATVAEDPEGYFSRTSALKGGGMRKKNKNRRKQYPIFRNSTEVVIPTPTDPEDASSSGNMKIMPCIPYARCLPYGTVQEGVPEIGRCECDKGYIETKKGKCNLPYNAPCDTHAKNKKDVCDESVPLYCVNNLCGCKNSLDVFEDETKLCKKSIGSLCWKDPSCVGTARCIRYSPRLPGRCMCPPNTHPDSTASTCVPVLSYDVDADSSIGYEEDEDDIEEGK